MAEHLNLDLNDLTIAEIETIEDLTDLPIDAFTSPSAKRGKMLRAIGYVLKRREDPSFTWEQAGDLRINLDDGGADDGPPLDGAA